MPAELIPGVGAVPTVPDGDLSGWVRLAFFETHLDVGDSTLNEIRTKSEVYASVVLDETIAPLPANAIPFTEPERAARLQPFTPTMPLEGFAGPFASLEALGKSFALHMLLAVSPRLLASLELTPRTELGPLDLFDQAGQLAVATRWFSSASHVLNPSPLKLLAKPLRTEHILRQRLLLKPPLVTCMLHSVQRRADVMQQWLVL